MFTKAVIQTQKRGVKLFFASMAQRQDIFRGQGDRYDGITVDSRNEPCDLTLFPDRLEASINQWIKDNKRTIWFKVDLSQTYWIPELTKRGFIFHHARNEQATLFRWLQKSQVCNVPPYAHTVLGVGAAVLNEKTNDILVVKENRGTQNWKLPGGYVEPGEDLGTAVEREVFEETGIVAKFKCMIAFRHAHEQAFGCSDIYAITCLTPETFDISKCEHEISECQWMKLDEFMNHPKVHDNNKFFAGKIKEYLEHHMGLSVIKTTHPLSKKPIQVFSITDTNKV